MLQVSIPDGLPLQEFQPVWWSPEAGLWTTAGVVVVSIEPANATDSTTGRVAAVATTHLTAFGSAVSLVGAELTPPPGLNQLGSLKLNLSPENILTVAIVCAMLVAFLCGWFVAFRHEASPSRQAELRSSRRALLLMWGTTQVPPTERVLQEKKLSRVKAAYVKYLTAIEHQHELEGGSAAKQLETTRSWTRPWRATAGSAVVAPAPTPGGKKLTGTASFTRRRHAARRSVMQSQLVGVDPMATEQAEIEDRRSASALEASSPKRSEGKGISLSVASRMVGVSTRSKRRVSMLGHQRDDAAGSVAQDGAFLHAELRQGSQDTLTEFGSGLQARSAAFFCRVYGHQLRAFHPCSFFCAPAEALVVYSRPQRIAVLCAIWLTSMAVSAVLFGSNPASVEVRLGVAVFSTLIMMPAAMLIPLAFHRTSIIVSQVQRGKPAPTIGSWTRTINAAKRLDDAKATGAGKRESLAASTTAPPASTSAMQLDVGSNPILRSRVLVAPPGMALSSSATADRHGATASSISVRDGGKSSASGHTPSLDMSAVVGAEGSIASTRGKGKSGKRQKAQKKSKKAAKHGGARADGAAWNGDAETPTTTTAGRTPGSIGVSILGDPIARFRSPGSSSSPQLQFGTAGSLVPAGADAQGADQLAPGDPAPMLRASTLQPAAATGIAATGTTRGTRRAARSQRRSDASGSQSARHRRSPAAEFGRAPVAGAATTRARSRSPRHPGAQKGRGLSAELREQGAKKGQRFHGGRKTRGSVELGSALLEARSLVGSGAGRSTASRGSRSSRSKSPRGAMPAQQDSEPSPRSVSSRHDVTSAMSGMLKPAQAEGPQSGRESASRSRMAGAAFDSEVIRSDEASIGGDADSDDSGAGDIVPRDGPSRAGGRDSALSRHGSGGVPDPWHVYSTGRFSSIGPDEGEGSGFQVRVGGGMTPAGRALSAAADDDERRGEHFRFEGYGRNSGEGAVPRPMSSARVGDEGSEARQMLSEAVLSFLGLGAQPRIGGLDARDHVLKLRARVAEGRRVR
jgi:hypothetical protein